MSRNDPRLASLRQRYSDIFPAGRGDPALESLIRDLDAVMNAPVLVAAPSWQPAPRTQTEHSPHPDAPEHHGSSLPYGNRRPARRLGLWVGAAAALLIVSLLGGLLLSHRGGTTPTQIGGSPTAATGCAPTDIKATLPSGTSISDLAMVSPGEGWAVGTISPENRSVGPLILHYHHCDWTQVPLDIPTGEVDSVSMISADEGWAVGGTFSLADGNQPLVLHYTHGSWQRETLDALTPPYPMPLAIRMLSATDGWMTMNNGGLLHLDNGTWTAVNSPFGTFADILPVAPNQVWVAGFTAGDEPLLEKYDAGTWTPARFPAHVMIERLRMVAPNNIWASGFISAPSNQYVNRTAAVLHFDGSKWQQVAISTSGKPQIVHAFDSKTAWAFTVKPSSSPKLRWSYISAAQYQHDGAWHEVAWPFTNVVSISSINRAGSDTFWAIGATLLGGVDTGYSALLYFANGSWHEYGG